MYRQKGVVVYTATILCWLYIMGCRLKDSDESQRWGWKRRLLLCEGCVVNAFFQFSPVDLTIALELKVGRPQGVVNVRVAGSRSPIRSGILGKLDWESM